MGKVDCAKRKTDEVPPAFRLAPLSRSRRETIRQRPHPPPSGAPSPKRRKSCGISGFASGETDFDKSKIWQNHRGRLFQLSEYRIAETLVAAASTPPHHYTRRCLRRHRITLGGLEAAATSVCILLCRFETTPFWQRRRSSWLPLRGNVVNSGDWIAIAPKAFPFSGNVIGLRDWNTFAPKAFPYGEGGLREAQDG